MNYVLFSGCMNWTGRRWNINRGGGGGVYSYIHVLSGKFLFKLINLNLIGKKMSGI